MNMLNQAVNDILLKPYTNKKLPVKNLSWTIDTIASVLIDTEGYENLKPQDIKDIAEDLRFDPLHICAEVGKRLDKHIQRLINDGEICPYCCYPIKSYGCSGCGEVLEK